MITSVQRTPSEVQLFNNDTSQSLEIRTHHFTTSLPQFSSQSQVQNYASTKTQQKLPLEELPQNIEGYYYKQLWTAKKTNSKNKQIFYLEKLTDFYLKKNKRDQTVQLLNSALEYIQKGMEQSNDFVLNLQHLKFAQKKYSEHPLDIAQSYSDLGFIHYNLENYNRALDFHEKALTTTIQVFDENHPALITSYKNIGDIYIRLGLLNIALHFCYQALRIGRQFLGDHHLDVASTFGQIGIIHYYCGHYKRALYCFQKELMITLELLENNHFNVALIYYNIGLTSYSLGDYEKSSDFFDKASEICPIEKIMFIE